MTYEFNADSIWSMFTRKQEFKNGGLAGGASPRNDATQWTNHSAYAYRGVRKIENYEIKF